MNTTLALAATKAARVRAAERTLEWWAVFLPRLSKLTAIQTISSHERTQWSALFRDVPALRTCVASVLEGRCGRLLTGPGANGTAWIEALPFLFPAGNVEGSVAEAFLESVGEAGGVVVGTERWLVEIERHCAGRTLRTPSRRQLVRWRRSSTARLHPAAASRVRSRRVRRT